MKSSRGNLVVGKYSNSPKEPLVDAIKNGSLKEILEKVSPGCFFSLLPISEPKLVLVNYDRLNTQNFYFDKGIYQAIQDSGIYEKYPDLSPVACLSQADAAKFCANEIVKDVLNSLMGNKIRFEIDVSSRLTDLHLYINIVSAHFRDHELKNEIYARIEKEYPRLTEYTGAESIRINLAEQPSYYSKLVIVADDDEDDDDIENPNWPSTTGNPSGGGRGNNPPA